METIHHKIVPDRSDLLDMIPSPDSIDINKLGVGATISTDKNQRLMQGTAPLSQIHCWLCQWTILHATFTECVD